MKKFGFLVVALLACLLVVGIASAEHAHGKGAGRGKGKGDFGQKATMKIGLALKNQEELGITDEQAKELRTLKLDTSKTSIRQNAEIAVIGVEIKALMWEDELDVAEVNKLIDKKYELKKEQAKAAVETCAQVRKILTKEQREQMKKMCGNKSGGRKQAGKGKCQECMAKKGGQGKPNK